MRVVFIFVLFGCFIKSHAQAVHTPVSGNYTSLTTYSTTFTDVFSLRANTASLAGSKEFSAGVYSERRFLLQELTSYSLAAVMPTASGNFGFSGNYYGGPLYNEAGLGLGYGRKLGDKTGVGVQFHYTSLNAGPYGRASAVTFDAGAVFQLTDAVKTGISVYNPVGMKFGKDKMEDLPAVYRIGMGYDASPQLFIGAEAQKTEGQPVSINAGIYCLFADKLIARGGIISGTTTYYMGMGVKLATLRVDVTAAFHPYLGLTPGLLIIYAPVK